jgi:hypothetical protein
MAYVRGPEGDHRLAGRAHRLSLATPASAAVRSCPLVAPFCCGWLSKARSRTPVRVRRRWSASRPFVRWGAAS